MRLSERRSVVFPHPDGPISAVISCLWIGNVMSRTAATPL